MSVGHLDVFFGKIFSWVFCPFLMELFGLFDVELYEFFVYSCPLNNTDLNCAGPLLPNFFSVLNAAILCDHG